MRTHAIALAAIAAMFFFPASAVSQEVEIGPGVRIGPGFHEHYGRGYYGGHRRAYGGQCRELRQACLHKEELGEQGMGNCRRYREVCGRY